ncbi:MAG: response regulator [Candidatus Limivivens sp.]|nr:response regulator [Candidatus Limivivens sp.]
MKLLIVDDCPGVVAGLLSGVHWNDLGIDEVYTAGNAEEAKECIKKYSIDIMLCDIEMPGENGIELLQWIKAGEYQAECIFLTSHAEFQYAQEALKLGAVDYVIQPASYAEVEQVITRTIQKRNKNKEKEKYYYVGRTVQTQLNDLVQGAYRDYLNGMLNDRSYEGMVRLGYFPGISVTCYLVLFQVVRWKVLSENWNDELLEFSVSNIMQEILGTDQAVVFKRMERNVFAGIIYAVNGPLSGEEEFQEAVETVQELCERYFHFISACYLSDRKKFEELPDAWEELLIQKNENVSMKKGVFLLSDRMGEDTKRENETIVQFVMEYVRFHLSDELRRDELADAVHLNADYLTRLFKQETGISLKQYIITEKMKEARQMLQTTSLPISLIAAKLGYSNFSHFSSTYKKYYDISPGDERNKEQ